MGARGGCEQFKGGLGPPSLALALWRLTEGGPTGFLPLLLRVCVPSNASLGRGQAGELAAKSARPPAAAAHRCRPAAPQVSFIPGGPLAPDARRPLSFRLEPLPPAESSAWDVTLALSGFGGPLLQPSLALPVRVRRRGGEGRGGGYLLCCPGLRAGSSCRWLYRQ